MKHLRRLTALLLAVVLAVYGLPELPAVSATSADASLTGTDGTVSSPRTAQLPQTSMRFVQTGFDNATGILTMALQVKPNRTVDDENVFEGYFTFQANVSTLIMVTRPANGGERESIGGSNGRVMVISSSENPEIEAYASSEAAFRMPGSFRDLMSPPKAFNANHTALFAAREVTDRGVLMDYFFQFRFEDNTRLDLDENGYATVMDFDFQCYAGVDGNGFAKPAANTEALFKGSLLVPQTAEEAEAICRKFDYIPQSEEGGAARAMTMGGAAFLQKYFVVGWEDTEEYISSFYYFDPPQLSRWRSLIAKPQGGSTAYVELAKNPWDGAKPITAEAAPGLWYEQCDSLYVIESFDAINNNTHSGDESYEGDPADADFTSPTLDEVGVYPRYVIPTEERSQRNDEQRSWIPDAYLGLMNRSVKMKYYVNTGVSSMALSSPEHEGLQTILDKMQWSFLLDGVVSLEDCKTVLEEGEGQLLPTPDGDRLVKTAVIQDEDLEERYQGAKVWKVYTEQGEYLMTTPVGVLMYMDPETEISFYDRFAPEGQQEKTERGGAPQLYVTNQAADSDSYIWKNATSGQFFIRAVYDPENLDFVGTPQAIRLYKDAPTPERADLRTEQIGKIPGANGEEIDGFFIGNAKLDGSGAETAADRVAQGLSVHSTLYDQYGAPMEGLWNKLTLEPYDEETKAALEAAGKTNPFEVTQVMQPDGSGIPGAVIPTDEYTIIYKTGTGPNSAVRGSYVLRAEYYDKDRDKNIDHKKIFYIDKPEDRLNYVSADFRSSSTVETVEEESTPDGMSYVVRCQVPTRSAGVTATSAVGSINILELANQWRVPDQYTGDIETFDILPGIRTEDGQMIDIDKARKAGIGLAFTWGEGSAVPNGVNIGSLQSEGRITYSNAVADGAEFVCELTATYGDETRVIRYCFQFYRDDRFLQSIVIRPKGSETAIAVEVPEANRSAVEYGLNVLPMDQYDTQWNWGDIAVDYAPGGRLNKDNVNYGIWTVECVDEGGLPKGVTLEGENHSTLRVTSAARNSVIHLQASFAGVTSPVAEVLIQQQPSVPVVINNLSYTANNVVIVPTKAQETLELTPSINIYNQYNDLMTEEEYTASWRSTVTPIEARSFVKINSATGAMTVAPCAPECTVNLTVVIRANGVSKSHTAEVAVQRESTRVETMEIVQDSISYPNRSLGINTSSTFLQVRGETQYGVGQELSGNDLTWILEAVKFPDGNYVYDSGAEGVGDIDYDAGTGRYTARSSVTLSSSGTLSFLSITDPNAVPETVTVSARYLGSVTTSKTIDVERQISVIDNIYFPNSVYSGGIQVPEVGKTNTLQLEAYPRDQYGLYLTDPLTWSLPEGATVPAGVKIDLEKGEVTVDNTAQQCSIPLVASCAGISQTVYVSVVQNEALRVGSVEVTGIRNRDSMELPLPAAKGGNGFDTYTVLPLVRDQFNNPMSGAVNWSVAGVTGGASAEFTDTVTGVLRVKFSEAAWQSGSSTITVRATSDSDPTKYGEGVITLVRQASKATYAVPEVTDYGTETETVNGNVLPVIPAKGAPAAKVSLRASVYDQYGKEMPGEAATLRLGVLGTGLSVQANGSNTAVLSIGSTVVGRLVQIVAVPAGVETILDESRLQIQLSKGTSYACGLNADREYTFAIPTWSSPPAANTPADASTDQTTLRAEVVDQYDAWMQTATWIYPVWEFVGDHEGVSFAGDMKRDSSGSISGEDLILDVSNLAIEDDETRRDITLRVYAYGHEGEPDFTETVTLHLTKRQGTAAYLYIDDVNEDGSIEGVVNRPYAKDKKTEYQFNPVVYDQYGRARDEEEITLELVKDSVEAQGYLVEEIGRAGDGQLPDSYKIYRVEQAVGGEEGSERKVLVAEFDRKTGKLTVYTECRDMKGLTISATSKTLGVTKRAQVLIGQEEPRIDSVEVGGAEKSYSFRGNEEDTDISQYIYPVVYDQYGQVYTGRTVATWTLYLPAATAGGEYLPYDTELGPDGEERLPGQFLMQLGSTRADGSNTLLIKSESFFQSKTFILRCQVRNRNNLEETVLQDMEIRVQQYGAGVRRGLIVTFDAGEYGKLVGHREYAVEYGSPPEITPGVKSMEGYGFMGWTADGKTVVDASKVPIYNYTAYVAVYRDVTATQFLDGYANGLVRPSGAVTRAEFVKMLISAIGGYDPNENYGVPGFSDVKYGKWYTNYIAYAHQHDLIDGYPDGSFRPDANISRAEAARVLADAMQLQDNVYTGVFKDVPANTWCASYVENLHQAGVVSGYDDGTFRPRKAVTRAEAVKMIVMITENAPSEFELANIRNYAYCPFKDIKRDYWAYPYILRAAGVA